MRSNNNYINDDIVQNHIQLEQHMQNCHHHSVADQLYSYNSAEGTYKAHYNIISQGIHGITWHCYAHRKDCK